MSSEVGQAHISIVPRMVGFKAAISKEAGATGTASSKSFSSSFGKAGTLVGAKLGKTLKSSFAASSKGMADSSLKAFGRDVQTASAALSRARLAQQDATGKVRVAEARYQETLAKYGPEASQTMAAEERLASLRRKSATADEAVASATARLTSAKSQLKSAESQLASVQSGLAGSSATLGGRVSAMAGSFRAGWRSIDAGRSAATGLAGAFGSLAGTVAGPATKAISGLAGRIAPAFAPVGERVSSMVGTVRSGFASISSSAQGVGTGLVSKLTTPLSGIASTISSKLSPLRESMGAVFDKLPVSASGAISGIGSAFMALGPKIASGIKGASSAALGAVSSLASSIGSALSTGAGALSAGLVAAAKIGVSAFGDLNLAVLSLQRVTGGSVESVSRLRGAMQLSGMDTDAANTSLTIFSKKLQAASTSSDAAAKMSATLGVSITDANGNLRDTTDLLPEVANKFAGMQNGAEKTALAVQLFGRNGMAMMPFLNEGAAGIEKLGGRAQALGLVLDDAAQKKFLAFKGAVRTIGVTMQGLGVSIGSAVLPLLTSLANAFTTMITPFVIRAASAVQKLGGFLDGVAKRIDAVTGSAGGIKDILAAIPGPVAVLGAAFAGLASGGIAKMASSLPMFGPALGSMLGPLKALSGPLGIAALAIGAFVATGADVKGFSSTVMSAIDGMVARLPGAISSLSGMVSGVVTGILQSAPAALSAAASLIATLAQGIVRALPMIGQGFSDLGERLGGIFRDNAPAIGAAAADLLDALVQGLTVALPALLEAGLGIVTSLLQGISDNLPTIMAGATQVVSALLQGLLAALPGLVQAGLQTLGAFISGVIQAIPLLIQAVATLVPTLINGLVADLPQLIECGGQFLATIVQGIIDNLPALVESAIALISALVQGLIDNMPQIVDAGVQLLLSLADGLLDDLPKLISAAITIILEIVAGLIANAPKLVGAAIELIIALAGGLIQAIPQLVARLPQIVMAIKDGFANVDWAKVGRDIIQGIIDGIKGMAGAVGRAVGGIIDFIGGFFPHSPAKRGPMSGKGYPGYSGAKIMRDMARGMRDGVPELEAAAKRAARAASVRAQSYVGALKQNNKQPAGQKTTNGGTMTNYFSNVFPRQDPNVTAQRIALQLRGTMERAGAL